MPKQLEIDFSAGEQPRKLIRARIQDLVNLSLNESTAHVTVPGKFADTEKLDNKRNIKAKDARRYKVSSLF